MILPKDSEGNICGVSDGYENKPYQFYFDATKMFPAIATRRRVPRNYQGFSRHSIWVVFKTVTQNLVKTYSVRRFTYILALEHFSPPNHKRQPAIKWQTACVNNSLWYWLIKKTALYRLSVHKIDKTMYDFSTLQVRF